MSYDVLLIVLLIFGLCYVTVTHEYSITFVHCQLYILLLFKCMFVFFFLLFFYLLTFVVKYRFRLFSEHFEIYH